MSFVRKNLKNIIVSLSSVIFALALVLVGVFMINSSTSFSSVNCKIFSTEDGTYYNATNGGRVYLGTTQGGVNSSFSARVDSNVTLRAVANDGYAFAGFYEAKENGSLLSNQSEYTFTVTAHQQNIHARFAKLYPVTLSFEDPFSEGQILSVEKLCYVGQYITTYDLINEKYGSDYAEQFQNSTPVSSNQSVSEEYVLAQSAIVVGPQAANLTIEPTPPVEVGLPSGLRQTNEVLVVYGAKGVTNFGVKNPEKHELVEDTRYSSMSSSNGANNYKTYRMNLNGTSSEDKWCRLSKLELFTETSAKYVVTSSTFRYYDKQIYYSGLFPQTRGWTAKANLSSININSKDVGAVEIYMTTSEGYIATFYSDASNMLETRAYSKNAAYSMPLTLPTKDGFVFAGWTTSKTSNKVEWASGNKTLTKDTSWYPVWQRDNTLTYTYITAGGQKATFKDNQSKNNELFSAEDAIAASMYMDVDEVPNRQFQANNRLYTFVGYSLTPTADPLYGNFNDTTGRVNEFEIFGQPVTLYGVYQSNVTITYDPTWGSNPPEPSVYPLYKVAGPSSVLTPTTDCILSNTIPTIENGTFLGWVYDEKLYSPGTLLNTIKDITVQAKWQFDMILPGSGTENDPYTISNVGQFKSFMACVNDGRYSTQFFKLTTDLVLPVMEPVGGYNKFEQKICAFKGVFDGSGYTITYNLDWTGSEYGGLFGYNQGTIKNLTVAGTIVGGNFIGGVCGYNQGTITNCFNQVEVTGLASAIGGIAGFNNGIVDQCYNQKEITASPLSTGTAIGGVVGKNATNGIVRNAINDAFVQANKVLSAGGLVGENLGRIANSFNNGKVSGLSQVGGLVGLQTSGVVLNSYNAENIAAENNYVGGVIGSFKTGDLQYIYYFATAATDGKSVVQKALGSGTLGTATKEDPVGVYPFNTTGADAGIIMPGQAERSLLHLLNLGIDFFKSEDGEVYCSWATDEYQNASLYVNDRWNDIVKEGTVALGWTGGGTMNDPYQIGSIGDLQILSEKVNMGVTYKNSYFRVTYDINFADLTDDWIPIGGYNVTLGREFKFEGTFNGGNKVFKNFNLVASLDNVGVFGISGGYIQNIVIEDISITGKNNVGAIVGTNYGTVQNCQVTGTISATANNIGGIVGQNFGTIDKCISYATVSGSVKVAGTGVGGIAGQNAQNATIKNNMSYAVVQAETYQNVGGLVGENLGRVVNSLAQGSALAKAYVGGLVGLNKGQVQNAYAAGHITSKGNYTGGFIGHSTGTVERGYYLVGSATDKSGKVQTAFGSQTIGATAPENLALVVPFDTKGALTSEIFIASQKISDLLLALNMGQKYYDNQSAGQFIIWSKTNKYPVLWQNGFWNDTSLWTFDGQGTLLNPFLLKTQKDLEYLALFVNAGNSYEGQYFALACDIATDYLDTETNFTPIGVYTGNKATSAPFAGVLDGQGHKITGLLHYEEDQDYKAFIAYLTGTVQNLGIEESSFNCKNYAAGLVARNEGTILNSYYTGLVFSYNDYVGGICAENLGSISKTYTFGIVLGQNQDFGLAVGGIVAHNCESGEVYNSFTMVEMPSETYRWVGGIVGKNEGKVRNVSVNTPIDGLDHVGGIVGYNTATGSVISGYSSSTIVGQGNYIGSCVGRNDGGEVKYTFYLQEATIDGQAIKQTGIGVATLGLASVDDPSQTHPFTTSFETTPVELGGVMVNDLYMGMTVAHTYISSLEPNKYVVWAERDDVALPIMYRLGDLPLEWLPTHDESLFMGEGTEEKPYTINSILDLQVFVMNVNTGKSFAGQYVKLTADIDANTGTNNQWSAIGWYDADNKKSNYFAGTFDGSGYTISNIYINKASNYQGFFGYSTGTIKNLTVSGSITGTSYVGGIAGYSTGSIINCTSLCDVAGTNSYIGGLVGVNSGLISRCFAQGQVRGTNAEFCVAVGGLTGINLTGGEVMSSYSSTDVSANQYQWVGGIVGQNHGVVFNSYSTKSVTGSYYVGGIVGQNGGGEITNCYSLGKVKALNTYAGGVVGYNNKGKITNTFYLENNALDGTNNVQSGMGQAKEATALKDDANEFIKFTSLLAIPSTNIAGLVVTNLLDALNTFVLSDRMTGRVSHTWIRGQDAFPAFSFRAKAWDGVSSESFSGGNGTFTDPYRITSAAQLKYLQQQVSLGVEYQNTYFVLANDIYLNTNEASSAHATANVWTPIGDVDTDSGVHHDFLGHFNGQGYAVHGVFVNELKDYQGLFGRISGTLENICTFDGFVTGFKYLGGLVGWSDGTITNCFNSNIVESTDSNVGGIAGVANGIITASGNSGKVTANKIAGGIAGRATNLIINSFNHGIVECKDITAGGIAGEITTTGSVINSFNTADIFGTQNVGGIVGASEGQIMNAYNLGAVSASISNIGGIVGQNDGTVAQTYYLLSSASLNGLTQNGIGSATSSIFADILAQTATFTEQFKIQTLYVGGVQVSTFLDALNTWVEQNPTYNGISCYRWSMDGLYPQHHRFWQGAIKTQFSGGDGTSASPYRISSAEDLAALATRVNNGEDFFSKYFVLTSNIYLNDEIFEFDVDSGLVKVSDGKNTAYLGTGIKGAFAAGESEYFDTLASSVGTWYASKLGDAGRYTGKLMEWTSIGNVNTETKTENDFAGHFDGQGYVISGLYSNTSANAQGLFGYVSGVVKNVSVENSFILGGTYVGGVVASLKGTLTNASSTATVIATTKTAGGVVGYFAEAGTIQNAFNAGAVYAATNAGAVIGEAYGRVENVYTSTPAYYAGDKGQTLGALLGTSKTTPTNAYAWTGATTPQKETVVKDADTINSALEELNKKSKSSNWYNWTISDTGVAQFIKQPIWDGSVATAFSGGTGTKETPYLISSAKELAFFSVTAQRGVYAVLTADIYLNDETFMFMEDTGLVKVTDGNYVGYLGTGIPGSQSGSNAHFDAVPSTPGVWYKDDVGTTGAYQGYINQWMPIVELKTNLDGAGHTIYGLYSLTGGLINDAEKVTIQNMQIANSYVYSPSLAGAFVNTFKGGTLSSLTSSSVVIGGDVGGIVGKVTSEVTKTRQNSSAGYYDTYAFTRTQIKASSNLGMLSGKNVGGIASSVEFIECLESSYNMGALYAQEKAGGIIASYKGRFEEQNQTFTLSDCHNFASISGLEKVGGIAGSIDAGQKYVANKAITYIPSSIAVENVSNQGKVVGSKYTGGILGYGDKGDANSLKLKNLENTAFIFGGDFTGGIIGRIAYASLDTAENSGKVEAYASTGGIVGQGAVALKNTKNFAEVAGTNNVGGIVGYSYNKDYPLDGAYNFGEVYGTSVVGGIVGLLTSEGVVKNTINGGSVLATHTAGGIVGSAESGSITSSEVATSVTGDYYIGGIVGKAASSVTFDNCNYAYGLAIAENSSQTQALGIGLPNRQNPEEDDVAGINKYMEDQVKCVLGDVTVVDKNLFFASVGMDEIGATVFIIDNRDSYCMISSTIITPSLLGISPGSGISYLLTYKAKVTLTLNVNGKGEIAENDQEWETTYKGQTARKSIYANNAIGTLPVPTDEQYAFAGWFTDPECLGREISESTVYDFTFTKLYAKWVEATYTITADTQGQFKITSAPGWDISADGFKATKVVNAVEPIGALPTINQTGYLFEGWFADTSYIQHVTSSSLLWTRQDTTIYPRLTPNTLSLNIRLNEVEFDSSGISLRVLDENDTLVWETSNVQTASIQVDKLLAKGYYKVYASRKFDKLTEFLQIGQAVMVSGKVNFMVDYYSLNLMRADEGINTVYIAEENQVPVAMKDIHNNQQVYLAGQSIIVSCVVSTGNGYSWKAWIDENTGEVATANQTLVINQINTSYILSATSIK